MKDDIKEALLSGVGVVTKALQSAASYLGLDSVFNDIIKMDRNTDNTTRKLKAEIEKRLRTGEIKLDKLQEQRDKLISLGIYPSSSVINAVRNAQGRLDRMIHSQKIQNARDSSNATIADSMISDIEQRADSWNPADTMRINKNVDKVEEIINNMGGNE